jgi:hypothetical protein
MKIEVLSFKNCPNLEDALAVIRSVAPQATIEEIEIQTAQDAERMRFLGSPTIRMNGVDIEPSARSRTDYGLSCRTYEGSGVPSRELVERALLADDCCSHSSGKRGSLRFAFAASAAALIASSCCWLPLIFVGFGASAFGLSSSLEAFRPWLLGGAAVLLVPGFYLAYSGAPCCSLKSRRVGQAAVWVAAALVLGSSTFPNLAGIFGDACGGSACCALGEDDSASDPARRDTQGAETAVSEHKPAELTTLSANAQELKDAFNADKQAVKVLLIVSPRCPACRRGAQIVQKEALDHIKSDNVKVFVVWIKRYRGDSRDAAKEATSLVPDRRARHFWDGSGELSRRYAKVVELPGKRTFAWDVYFVYSPKANWAEVPPTPDFWMHQLGGSDTGNLLDGPKFRAAIARQLP